MRRHYYENNIPDFCIQSRDEILGVLVANTEFSSETTQVDSWKYQIEKLQVELTGLDGHIFMEYAIPRMGRRIDVLLLVGHLILVLEFKVGEKDYPAHAVDQVWDYALDLKNFHETSHHALIVPVLICTLAPHSYLDFVPSYRRDSLMNPIKCRTEEIKSLIQRALLMESSRPIIDPYDWKSGRYAPTPTIVEAATALYRGHGVANITRTDAGAENLSRTSETINAIISESRSKNQKSICFVTGVPGAGKTLVGLNIATQYADVEGQAGSVFLSGNGPLVAVLREALTRDKVARHRGMGQRLKKGAVLSEVKMFIQNVHHYRDEYLKDASSPYDHIAIFDEAQRAWNLEQTAAFMHRKKGIRDFDRSEPEFLISCLDRHKDWAVVVCLVGGGQEINTGEAGIGEWIQAIRKSFPHWDLHISDQLHDREYAAGGALAALEGHPKIHVHTDLHLSVSLRSYRAENLSFWVKSILDLELEQARQAYLNLKDRYPLVLTRDFGKAKDWVRNQARGTERYGLVVSSQAQRLKPYAIDVKSPMDPVHWFLDDKDDVRSSYYLEDVATEFHVQGLELDWACVAWDGDFRFNGTGWEHCSFVGNSWQRINKEHRRLYQKNAYRVLLTRARQGMVIVVPTGDSKDPTRLPSFYDGTYRYLRSIGICEI